eukprot:gene1573-443_t
MPLGGLRGGDAVPWAWACYGTNFATQREGSGGVGRRNVPRVVPVPHRRGRLLRGARPGLVSVLWGLLVRRVRTPIEDRLTCDAAFLEKCLVTLPLIPLLRLTLDLNGLRLETDPRQEAFGVCPQLQGIDGTGTVDLLEPLGQL